MDSKDLFKELDLEKLRFQTNQQPSSVLSDYFKILLRRKWLIAICTMAIVIPATIWTLNVTPIYKADATIIYDEADDTAFLLDFGQSFYSKSAIINMTEQVNSRTLAEKVAKSLPEEVIRTFKFPEQLPENFSRDKFIAGVIKENLAVQNVRGGDILKISVQAADPNAARIIANAYVSSIIDWSLQKNKQEISNIRNFVEGQLSILQDKLKAAEEDLLEFKEKNNLITLSDASSEVLENLTAAEVAYNQAKAEREALEQRRRFIEQKKQELMPSLVISNSKIAQQLKEELLNLETQYSSLQVQAGSEGQAKLASIREKINQTKKDLINELMRNAVRENLIDPLSQIRNLLQESITIEVDLETYKAREQGLKKTMDEYNAELQLLPEQELKLARLVRAKEVNDKIYGILLEKREEARITEAGKVGDVRVIDYADAPIHPIKPNKKKNFALAIVLGLSFGIGLAFLLNSLDNTIKSEQDLEQYIDLPVLASIPNISTNSVLQKITKKENIDKLYFSKLISQILTKPHVLEAYRSLKLNFSFLNPDKNLKSILVTSAGAGEGKTLTSINLAQIYARTGTKTMLMDCDLRRPMIHKALKIKQEPGLTNVLIDKVANLDSYVQIFDNENLNENLSVLTCGTLPPNPSELFSSKRMEDILTQAQDIYELIIIDAPPIISVTDSIILGVKVDGVLLVVRSGKTRCEAVQKAKKILENGKINVAGTVINDVDFKNVYGYYKDYYYYSRKK